MSTTVEDAGGLNLEGSSLRSPTSGPSLLGEPGLFQPRLTGWRWLLAVLGLATVYFLAGKLGRALLVTSDQVALIWPATGVAVAALLLGGVRLWPGIALGIFWLAMVEVPGAWIHILATTTGNILEAVTATFLLRRWTGFQGRFEDQREILSLIICGCLLSSPLTATFGVLSTALQGMPMDYALGWHWSRWWISSAIGMLITVPPILLWARARRQSLPAGRRLAEAGLVFATALTLALLIFTGAMEHWFGSFLLSYLLLPFVAWLALRFGALESTTLVFFLALVGSWGTTHGRGPFALIEPPLNVATFWPFVVILVLTALFLSTLGSERKRAEIERKEGLWLLRKVVDALPAAVRVCDSRARTLLLNRTQEEVFGLSSEEQLGKTYAELLDDEIGQQLTELDQEVLADHTSVPFQEVTYPDGRLWLQTKVPLPPASGSEHSFLGMAVDSGAWRALTVAFDITSRKEAEWALEQAEGRLRSILETVEGWILTVDSDGVIRYANRPFPEVELDDMIGSPVSEWVRESMREGFQGLLEATLAHQRGGSLEVQSSREPHRWLDCRVQPVLRDGKAVELILNILDIEKRKRAEVERERLMTEMQSMKNLESLGVLAGGIAHDFNNLLTGVIGNASLASMKLPDESDLQPFLAAIEEASEQAAELCQQMLAFAGKGQYVAASVDLSSLVRGLIKILRGQLSSKAEIQLDLANDLPEIRCDPTQLRRVVINLITNASDALDQGGGTIQIHTSERFFRFEELSQGHWSEVLEPGRYLHLEVRDTGQGMDAETLGKIYEPFFSTKFMGRGLGMAAASGVMRSYQGAVQVDSILGEGTVCRLFFPLPAEVMKAGTEVEVERTGELPGTILLADDEAVVAQVARQTLEDAGYSVLLAQDGREALEIFKSRKSELSIAVLDMTMPEITGAELLRRIRRSLPEFPVLLSSGFSEEDLNGRLDDNRWTGFVKKPYRPKDLLSAVYRALANSGGASVRP